MAADGRALVAHGITKRFKTGRTFVEVLHGVDFEARHGELTLIMGPSGSGKSTLVAALSGLLSPELREEFIGYAEIREVFNITKAGKVAGCMITEGVVKRGAKVRLLRDNVVIHEGTLKTLKRFKDEVKDVKAGFECGMAFENYEDIRAGDVIECFEISSHARTVEATKEVKETKEEAAE